MCQVPTIVLFIVMNILLLGCVYELLICTTTLPARIVPVPAAECPWVSVPAMKERAARDWKRAMPSVITTPRLERRDVRVDVEKDNMLVVVAVEAVSSCARRVSRESRRVAMRSVRSVRAWAEARVKDASLYRFTPPAVSTESGSVAVMVVLPTWKLCVVAGTTIAEAVTVPSNVPLPDTVIPVAVISVEVAVSRFVIRAARVLVARESCVVRPPSSLTAAARYGVSPA